MVLTTGERLRIGAGVDPTTLRKVLQALRDNPPATQSSFEATSALAHPYARGITSW